MALADPQSLTIDGTTHSLPRVSVTPNSGTYQNSEGTVTVTVTQHATKKGRERGSFRVDFSKVSPDPFLPAQNTRKGMSATVAFDVDPTGFSDAEAKKVLEGLLAELSKTSGALIGRLLGREY